MYLIICKALLRGSIVGQIYCFPDTVIVIVVYLYKRNGFMYHVVGHEQHCVTCLCMFNNRECNYKRFLDNVTEEGCFYFLRVMWYGLCSCWLVGLLVLLSAAARCL